MTSILHVIIPIILLVFLASCAGLKKSSNTSLQDTTKKAKSDVVTTIDSATAAIEGTVTDINKGIEDVNSTIDKTVSDVTDFFGSFIPGLKRKDSIMVVPPEPDNGPAVSHELPSSGGFVSTPIERKVTFDSLGNVIVSDEFLGSSTNIPLTQTLDDYLKTRIDYNIGDGLRDAAASRPVDFSQNSSQGSTDDPSKTGGEGFLSDYSSISIPIPPSIVPTIFGKPSINLRVNGDVAIHLAYRDNKFLATSGALFSGSESGLDFRQEINMSLSGSVGDKIKINTDFASLRQFSFENLFKLSYQGFPDEIIQSIEAGNVSLTTPSKYIGIQSALFGFKMVNRFGPMYLTAVAAQKKGERQSKQFGGGPGSNTGQEYIIYPANYRRNSFFLDTAFIPLYERFYSTIPTDNYFPDVITNGTLQVWRSTAKENPKRVDVVAWYSLPPTPSGQDYDPSFSVKPPGAVDEEVSFSYMEMLDTNQYKVDYKTGVLTLYQEPSDQQIIAVSYKTPTEQYGEQTSGKSNYVLKLIKPENVFQNASVTPWRNILKNTYYVGATNIDETGFSSRIIYTFPTGQVYEYVRSAEGQDKTISVTGLDRYNNSNPGSRTPDGAIDMIPNNVILDKRNGTLTFPYLEPFGQRILNYHNEQFRKNRDYKRDSTFYFPELYVNSQDFFQRNLTKNSKISINVKYAGGTSSQLQLNAFNIVEGSVRVTAGGKQLQEGVDYRVDINGGTVTLLRPDIASLGPINVDYDQHDFFTTNTKTLLGLRAELPILNRGGLGFSLMNYSMSVQSLKTRQGEEPFSNWVMGADASYSFPTNSITNILNALPIFNLKDKSEISAKLDFALSLPNPNTKESPMEIDGGKSIAYIDDFESGKTNYPLSMTYGRWVHASQPDSVPKYLGLGREEINQRKSKMWWYERAVQEVRITDIKPNRSTSQPNQTAQVLDVIYDPLNFNAAYNPTPAGAGQASLEDRWAGMMQWSQGLNVIANNTEAIEFWLKVEDHGGNNDAILHFDMGKISEDIIPDGVLETEDKNNNGRYDPDEDVGLDTITTALEQTRYPTANNPNDPDNDNYNYDRTNNPNNYDNINGTEGNRDDRAAGLRPDTEDLDGNSALGVANSYFQYDIPLRQDNNPFIVGVSPAGWLQFRVPISKYSKTIGNPSRSFSNIEYYRLWLTGLSARYHIRFHEITLVGSQWSKVKQADSVGNIAVEDSLFEINYVNIEENAGAPAFYTPPPGAERDRIAGQSTLVFGNEQSINLSVSCLPQGESRSAVRVFPTPHDLFNYRSMAIWAHGDSAARETLATPLDTMNTIWVTLRIGSDNFNYYEYRRPLVRGWQNLSLDFGILSSLKATKLRYEDIVVQPANDGVIGSMYRVVGSPSVTNSPYISIGLENQTTDDCLKTDVWFDELRLLEGNDQIDYAVNGLVQAKLAEFGTVSATFLNERADFHRVDERFSLTRARNFGWALTGEFGLQKILPSWLERGTQFPLTLSHSESIITPKYLPNTDVEIENAVRSIQQSADAGILSQQVAQQKIDSLRVTNETLTVRNSIAATGVKFTFPGSFFLLPLFVNQIKYGFGYGEEFNRSYQYEYNRSWAWTASLVYELNNIPRANVSLLKWIPAETFSIGRYSNYAINFLPSRFSTGLSMTRGRKHWIDRLSTLQYPINATAEDSNIVLKSRQATINRTFTADRGFGFTWKLTENGLLSPQIDFNLQVTSNMGYLETITDDLKRSNYYDTVYRRQREFGEILDDIFLTGGSLAKLGEDFQTIQKFKLTTSPRLPWLFWVDKYIRPIFNYNVDYRWTNSQTGLQNAKIGSWTNVINTGIELNLRPLGLDIFGSDAAPKRGAGVGSASLDGNTPPDGSFDNDTRVAGRPKVRRIGDVTPNANQSFLDTLLRSPSQDTPDTDTTSTRAAGIGTGGERADYSMSDTLLVPIAPGDEPKRAAAEPETDLGDILNAAVNKPLFDWNGTRFNFTQTNYSLNGALQGSGSGITNLLAGNIFHKENDHNGPSQAYQLGLITDPHGRLLVKFKPRFPFIDFEVRHGDRAPSPSARSIDITDVFTQKNTFELSTSRPLWAGAQISLNWKTEFTYDERNALRIDKDGKITELSVTKIGDVNRTFLSIPPLPFLDISQSSIKRVGEKWEQKSSDAGYTTIAARDTMPQALRNQLQSESFLEGFETLPLLRGALREFFPRLNYTFSWSGLEKLPIFSFVDRVSLRHAYNGNYRRTHRLDPNETEQLTTLQTVTYGFRPLVAFDMNWDKLFGGRMTSSLNYDTQTEWAADYSANRITRRFSSTFGINVNFQKEGLKFPLFGLNLKNTFGASLLVSQTISSDFFYQFNTITTIPDGIGNGGITKLTIEPRVSYDLSQKLTIEGFFRYERTTPAATGLLVPPTRLILAGFDIRLKIF